MSELWSVNSELWSLSYEVWTRSLNCEVWSMNFELWSTKYGLWSRNCEVWTMTCEVWTMQCEVWTVNWEVWTMNCEVWTMKSEIWSVKSELRCVKFEAWSLTVNWSDRVAERLAFPTSDRGSRFRIPMDASFGPNLNGASLHRAFYVYPFIVLIWLKCCWFGSVTANHPWIVNFEMALSVVFYT